MSNYEILSLVSTRIIRYNKLKYVERIEDILVNDSAVILIDNKNSSIGHWVCLIKRGNTLSYFDSYGREPDPKEYNIRIPYLSMLLYRSGLNVEYNDKQYQGPETSTCGRHVVARIILKDYSLAYYNRFMHQFKNDDTLVSALTFMAKDK